MKESLFLMLHDQEPGNPDSLSWYAPQSGEPTGEETPVENPDDFTGSGNIDDFYREFTEKYSDKKILAVVAGEYITYTNISTPIKNKRQILQALPFMVEEQIVSNIEDMHIAFSRLPLSDVIRVAVVSRHFIKSWTDAFEKNKVPVTAVFGFPDLLPDDPGNLSVAFYKNIALIKGSSICFQCETENVQTIFELIDMENITSIQFIHSEKSKNLPTIKKLKKTFENIPSEIIAYKGNFIDYLISNETISSSAKLNLLQGEFSLEGGSDYLIKKWMPVALVVILGLFLQIGFLFASGFYYRYMEKKINAESVALYMQLFPNEKKVVDVRAQLDGKLNNASLGGHTSRFPKIFTTSAMAISKIGSAKDIKLTSFRYDDESGELKVDMETSAVSYIDSLKEALVNQGLLVEIVSANQEESHTKAVLLIKAQ